MGNKNLWLLLGIIAFLLVVSGAIYLFFQKQKIEDTSRYGGKTADTKESAREGGLSNEEADETFVAFLKSLHEGATMGEWEDPSGEGIQRLAERFLTEESFKLMLITPTNENVYRIIFWALASGYSDFRRAVEARKSYAPPTPEQQRAFRSQIHIADGQIQLPESSDLPHTNLEINPQTGEVAFLPPPTLTYFRNDHVIVYENFGSMMSFVVALTKQPGGNWLLDFLEPFQEVPTDEYRHPLYERLKSALYGKNVERLHRVTPPLQRYVDSLLAMSTDERKQSLQPHIDPTLMKYEGLTTPEQFLGLLMRLTPHEQNESRVTFLVSNQGGTWRYELVKTGGTWSLARIE